MHLRFREKVERDGSRQRVGDRPARLLPRLHPGWLVGVAARRTGPGRASRVPVQGVRETAVRVGDGIITALS